MRRSFAVRLAAAFTGVGIAAAALTALLVNLSFGTRFTSFLEAQQQVRHEQLVAGLEESYSRMGGWNTTDLRSLQSLVLADGGTMRLLDPNGELVWNTSSGAAGQMAAMHREMMGSGPLGPEVRLPIDVNGSLVGTAIVRVPQPGLSAGDATFRSSINRLLLLGGLAAGLLAFVMGVVLARRATAPARQLTSAARALANGDRSHRVEYEAGDELGEMASAFNSMADTIEEEDRLRRHFASEVAHELRTPLAILSSQVEGMQDGVVEPTPAALASLHEETLRLTRLVADLETMASADAAGFSLVRRPVELASLLEEAAQEFTGPFEAAEVHLSWDLDPAEVEADPTRIRQVVANLLSNALKFTPPGGTVQLALAPEEGSVMIRVSDTGPGIPADELPRVFDRFFRGGSVRAGGSGIGLAVARELVVAHGGELEVASQPGKGATFTVRLPRVSPQQRGSFTAPSQPADTVGVKGGTEP